MKLGREYILTTQELDIYGTAKAYTGPVRLIHGSKDTIVPMSCSEKFVETYTQDAELIVIEGENNMITRKLRTVSQMPSHSWHTSSNSPIREASSSTQSHCPRGGCCPAGWRLPNQRETAVMFYYMIGKNPDGTSSNENKMGSTMTRTRWSFCVNGMYSFKIANKHGFRCTGTTITVNNDAINAARCVRDIRVQ